MTAPLRLLGLVGAGIGASRTPAMHEAAARRLGLSLSYRLIDTATLPRGPADLATLLRAAELMGFSGLNITHPFKVEVLGLLDEIAPGAARVGAVNTVVLSDGLRRGHNTDHSGFAAAFARDLAGAPRGRVLLLGAGGAGGAVAQALIEQGVRRLVLVDPAAGRAAALAARLGAANPGAAVEVAPDAAAAAAGGLDGVVNATPAGTDAHPGLPLAAGLLHPGLWVADIVYFPRRTALLAAAEAAGCRVMDGAGMAVYQAVAAFRLFTGAEPCVGTMRATFEALGP